MAQKKVQIAFEAWNEGIVKDSDCSVTFSQESAEQCMVATEVTKQLKDWLERNGHEVEFSSWSFFEWGGISINFYSRKENVNDSYFVHCYYKNGLAEIEIGSAWEGYKKTTASIAV